MFDYAPYAPRPTESHGIVGRAGHRLKLYTVRLGERPVEIGDYDDGLEAALSALPSADPAQGRPGLGFVIVHRGRDMDYIVIAWWDRENELPVRVFVREHERPSGGDDSEGTSDPGARAWRPAGTSESFCVWDMEILAHERDAYVETVLGGELDGAERYLERWPTHGG